MMYKKIPVNSEEAYDENAQTIPLEKLYMMSWNFMQEEAL